jgi:hypothetical protein
MGDKVGGEAGVAVGLSGFSRMKFQGCSVILKDKGIRGRMFIPGRRQRAFRTMPDRRGPPVSKKDSEFYL